MPCVPFYPALLHALNRLLTGSSPAILLPVKELDQAAAVIAAAFQASQQINLELCLSELLHAGIIEIGPEYHGVYALSQADHDQCIDLLRLTAAKKGEIVGMTDPMASRNCDCGHLEPIVIMPVKEVSE